MKWVYAGLAPALDTSNRVRNWIAIGVDADAVDWIGAYFSDESRVHPSKDLVIV